MAPKTWAEARATAAKALATAPTFTQIWVAGSDSAQFVRDYIEANAKEFSEILCSDKISPGWIRLRSGKDDIHMMWAKVDGKAEVVAFAQAALDPSTGAYHVETICARSGSGQGGQLLNSVELFAFKAKSAKAVTLDAITSAIGFYEKQGQVPSPSEVTPEAFSDVKKVLQLTAESKALRAKLGVLADLVPMMKAKGAGRKKTLRKTRRRTKSRR